MDLVRTPLNTIDINLLAAILVHQDGPTLSHLRSLFPQQVDAAIATSFYQTTRLETHYTASHQAIINFETIYSRAALGCPPINLEIALLILDRDNFTNRRPDSTPVVMAVFGALSVTQRLAVYDPLEVTLKKVRLTYFITK